MKKLGLLVIALFAFSSVWAQSVDLSQVDVSDIDFSQVDLSGMEFYFQGPAQFYVSGVGYMGRSYAGILDYDGMGNLTVKAPSKATIAGKPQAIDLSMASVKLLSDGVMLNDVVIEGFKYSGKLVYTQGTTLAFRSYSRGSQVSSAAPAMASKPASSTTTSVDVSGYQKQIDSLKKENQTLQQQTSQAQRDKNNLQQEVSSLKQQLAEAKAAASGKPAPAATSTTTRVVTVTEKPAEPSSTGAREMLANFSSKGQSAYGSWSKSGSSLRSTDSSNLFAKYRYDVPQTANELFYEFTATMADDGWTGYGMHMLINGEESYKGYGLGSSLLIWVTRDPKMQTENGYIQAYRSYDDVRMVEVASQITAEPLPKTGTVKVYLNRQKGIITVYFNGMKVINLNAGMTLPSSSKIALRTLGGPVQFTNVSVKGK